MMKHGRLGEWKSVVAAAAMSLLLCGCHDAGLDVSRSSLSRFAFPAPSLPRNVKLAPWGGSDKLPWMTGNPFASTDRKVLAELEDGNQVAKETARELLQVVYNWEEPGGGTTEIGVMAVRFKDAASAEAATKGLKPRMDENARVEPHTAPTLLHRGDVVCILQHSSAVDKDVWAAMVKLADKALAESD